MSSELTSSVRAAGPLLGILGAAGLDLAAVEGRLGLGSGSLADPDARRPAASLARLWDLAEESLGDPFVGLHLAGGVSRETFDVFSFIACASVDLGEALGRIRRYFRLLTDAASYELHEAGARGQGAGTAAAPGPDDDADAWWTYRLEPSIGVARRQAHEFGLAVSCAYARLWLDDGFVPSGVCFPHTSPPDPGPLEEFFGAPVEFGAELCGFRFPAADLARPLRTADPDLVALLERFADDALAALPEPGRYAGRVRELVVAALPDGDLSLAAFASSLAMSERSLQRHLRDEGTSLKGLLEEVRRELAVRYLADPALTASEVAYLVGYSETAPFFRAFKRWTGRTPGESRPG